MPTPIARMLDRLQRETSSGPLDQFDSAWLLIEMLIKYTTTVAVTLLGYFDSPRAHGTVAQLIDADSIGTWVSTLERTADRLARIPDNESKKWARLLKERISRTESSQHNLILTADEVNYILNALDRTEDSVKLSQRPNLLKCFAALVVIRNKTRGHGAYLQPFYRDTAPHLARAASHLVDLLGRQVKLLLVKQVSPTGQTLALQLDGPSPTNVVVLPKAAEPDSLWIRFSESLVLQAEPLMFVDPVDHDTSFLNGDWNESTLQVATLSYITGKVSTRLLPGYRSHGMLLASETEGRSELIYSDDLRIPHNLPAEPQDYVSRAGLEQRLRTLLLDETHRLISLNGRGGSGKTTLALKMCHQLTRESSRYACVVWVSGRDIDLTIEGPVPRRQQVRKLEDFLEMMMRVLELPKERDPAAAVSGVLGDQKGAYLVVIDNLETFDNPLELLRFLDEHVSWRSKVLITSRHERFRGDYPLEVTGMDEGEARRLIALEARRHYCEGRLDDKVIRRMLQISDRIPYVLKLLVAQFAAVGSVDQAYSRVTRHEELMEALFGRSFDLLSEHGQWLYLFMSEREWVPGWLVSGVMEFSGYGYGRALEELRSHSLVEVDAEEAVDGEERVLRVGDLLQRHGASMLVGHELERSVRRAVEFVHGVWIPSIVEPVRAIGGLWEAIGARRSAGGLAWRELMRLGEAMARQVAGGWRRLAQALEEAGVGEEEVRRAYKYAVEADPLDAFAWKAFSEFEERRDPLKAALYGARAIDCGLEDVEFAVRVAGDLARLLTQENGFLAAERPAYVTGVISLLERRQDELGATALSRLGWLYLMQSAPDTDPDGRLIRKAHYYAEKGLSIEPDNKYCLQLLQRTREYGW
ncbi:MAG: hypothetical protein IRY83_14645 [Chloroflexi bacterium]|nr:hypothetical protein [Chloroflexota bacterium]